MGGGNNCEIAIVIPLRLDGLWGPRDTYATHARPFRHYSPSCILPPLWVCTCFPIDQHFRSKPANAANKGSTRRREGAGQPWVDVSQGTKRAAGVCSSAAVVGESGCTGGRGAQHNLGMLYRDGQGVPQNNVKALMWLNLAAAPTDPTQKLTADIRDKVARFMTPAQIAEAQRLAQEC